MSTQKNLYLLFRKNYLTDSDEILRQDQVFDGDDPQIFDNSYDLRFRNCAR